MSDSSWTLTVSVLCCDHRHVYRGAKVSSQRVSVLKSFLKVSTLPVPSSSRVQETKIRCLVDAPSQTSLTSIKTRFGIASTIANSLHNNLD